MLVMAQTNPLSRQGRDADQLHAAGPHSVASTRAVASLSCCDLSARYRGDCVREMTQRQCRNGVPLKTSRGSKTERAAMSRKCHTFLSSPPQDEGVTNRRGGKRWTGSRLLPVPPCQPTSRRADQLGGIRSRLFPIFLSSRHPPCQRPHHQGQPGTGPQHQHDRAFGQSAQRFLPAFQVRNLCV